jgi:hypothetical protein
MTHVIPVEQVEVMQKRIKELEAEIATLKGTAAKPVVQPTSKKK